jgi:hypothetical protein
MPLGKPAGENSVMAPTAAQAGALLRLSRLTQAITAAPRAARRDRHPELFMFLPLFLSFPRSFACGKTDGEMFHKILLALSHGRYLQTFRLYVSIRRGVTSAGSSVGDKETLSC